jgi:hypothetical protein
MEEYSNDSDTVNSQPVTPKDAHGAPVAGEIEPVRGKGRAVCSCGLSGLLVRASSDPAVCPADVPWICLRKYVK